MGLDAFEDFDEIEISGAESQAVDALDEDLFDFPLPDMPHLKPATPTVATAPAVPEPVAAAAAAAPTPAHALPTVGVASSPAGQMNLDDDLFEFPDVFSGALLATPLEDDLHASVQSDNFVVAEQDPGSSASAPFEAAPVPVPEPHFTPEPEARPPQSRPVPAVTATTPEPARVAANVPQFEQRAPAQPHYEPAPQLQGYKQYLPPSDEETAAIAVPAGGRSHLTEILAVGFLVLNVALVLFAYQANASFHDTLTEVTRSVAAAVTNNRANAQEIPPTISFPLPPLTQDPGNQLPGEALDLRLQSMALARRMVEEERYFDARRVLYRLLANRDLAVLDTNFVAEAEYLIAESYELQGKALAEVQR